MGWLLLNHRVGQREQLVRHVEASVLAVLRLIAKSNLVGCVTGRETIDASDEDDEAFRGRLPTRYRALRRYPEWSGGEIRATLP